MQLAVLATYVGDELLAVYRYCRSLAVESPFLTSRDNLVLLFEKNRQLSAVKSETGKSGQISELPKAVEDKKSDKGDQKSFLGEVKHAIKEWKLEDTAMGANSASNLELRKRFCMHFVRLYGILFTRTSLETFSDIQTTTMWELEQLLAGDDTSLEAGLGADHSRIGMTSSGASDILQLVVILIFAVSNVNSGTEIQNQTYAEVLQRSSLLQYAFSAAFECAGRLMRRCSKFREPASSPFLPAMLVFLEWLACQPEMALRSEVNEKQASARTFFWRQCVNLLNLLTENGFSKVDQGSDPLQHQKDDSVKKLALWEDYELRGFLPLLPTQSALDFSNRRPRVGTGDKKEFKIRVQRFLSAGRAVAKTLESTQKDIIYDFKEQKFYMAGDVREEKKDEALKVKEMKSVKDEEESKVSDSGIHPSLNTMSTSSGWTMQTSAAEQPSAPSLKIPSVPVSKKEDEDEEVIVFKPLSKDQEAASVAAEIFLQPTLLPTSGYSNPRVPEVPKIQASVSLHDFQGPSTVRQGPLGSPFDSANYSMSSASLGGPFRSGPLVDLAVPTPWMSSSMSGSATTAPAAALLPASAWTNLSRMVDASAPAYSHTDLGDWVLANRSGGTNSLEKLTSAAGLLGQQKQPAVSSSFWSSQLEALATNNLPPNLQLGSLSLNGRWGAETKPEVPATSQLRAPETGAFPGIISPPNPTRVGPPAMRPPPGFGPLPAKRVGSPAPISPQVSIRPPPTNTGSSLYSTSYGMWAMDSGLSNLGSPNTPFTLPRTSGSHPHDTSSPVPLQPQQSFVDARLKYEVQQQRQRYEAEAKAQAEAHYQQQRNLLMLQLQQQQLQQQQR
jgi:protein SMG7